MGEETTVIELLPYIVMGAVFIFSIKQFISTSKVQKKIKNNKHEKLLNENFNVSKEITVNVMPGLNEKLLVDDVNKRFATVSYLGCNIYNFSDLLAFELDEDGEVITSGRGLQTLIGGATFGVTGALIGGAGKRKSKATCSYMSVRFLLNSLENPQNEIRLINKDVRKKSISYSMAKSKANEITAILNYIINYNKSKEASVTGE